MYYDSNLLKVLDAYLSYSRRETTSPSLTENDMPNSTWLVP